MEAEEYDLEFEALVRELSPDKLAAEYVYFDTHMVPKCHRELLLIGHVA